MGRANDRPWYSREGLQQAATSTGYLRTIPSDRPVVFLLGVRITGSTPAWPVIKSGIGAGQALRSYPYWGVPSDYFAGVASKPNGKPQPVPAIALPNGGGDPVVLVLEAYNPSGFAQIADRFPERVIAPGVALARGPVPTAPLVAAAAPRADVSARSIPLVGALMVVLLFVVGSGWSVALVPPDAILRVSLAPTLGAAVTVLGAFVWDRVGLTLSLSGTLIALAIVTASGWAVAAWRRSADSRDPNGSDAGGPDRSEVPGGSGPEPQHSGTM